MAEDYDNMTVAELKVQLKEAGLPVSGKKPDLIARLNDMGDAPIEETVVEETVVEETVVEETEDDSWTMKKTGKSLPLLMRRKDCLVLNPSWVGPS